MVLALEIFRGVQLTCQTGLWSCEGLIKVGGSTSKIVRSRGYWQEAKQAFLRALEHDNNT